MSLPVKLVFVTDPMCSWCWGMASELAEAQQMLADQVSFDLMLGGINIQSTQPIGAYGRRYLMKLWRDVAATTGQRFGDQLPEAYVHNSTLPCMAVEVVREALQTPPFEYLHSVQEQFFVHGNNINERSVLRETASRFGVAPDIFDERLHSDSVRERVRFQFEHAKGFGTQALPSLLIEREGRLQLLAGGFVDAQMLVDLLEGFVPEQS